MHHRAPLQPLCLSTKTMGKGMSWGTHRPPIPQTQTPRGEVHQPHRVYYLPFLEVCTYVVREVPKCERAMYRLHQLPPHHNATVDPPTPTPCASSFSFAGLMTVSTAPSPRPVLARRGKAWLPLHPNFSLAYTPALIAQHCKSTSWAADESSQVSTLFSFTRGVGKRTHAGA